MSHIKCPKCGGRDHISGYGFAAGPMGQYTICECGKILEFEADTEGLPPEEVERLEKLTIKNGVAV